MTVFATAYSPEPERVDLDGIIDTEHNVEYIGEAQRQADGTYRCLARIADSLCTVQVQLTPVKR